MAALLSHSCNAYARPCCLAEVQIDDISGPD